MTRFNLQLETLFGKRGGESETAQFGRDARHDWQFVFVFFLSVSVLLLAGSIFVYRQVNGGELFHVAPRGGLSLHSLDRTVLKETADFFAAKQERFDALRQTPLSIAGPGTPSPVKK